MRFGEIASSVFSLLGNSKKRVIRLFLLFVFSSGLDLAGVALLGPYMLLIVTGDISRFPFSAQFGLDADFKFVLASVSVAVVTLFAFKSLVSAWVNTKVVRFSYGHETDMMLELVRVYQELPYKVIAEKGTSKLIQSVTVNTNIVTNKGVLPLLRLASETLSFLLVFSFLVYVDPLLTLVLSSLLLVTFMAYNRLFRSKLVSAGLEFTESTQALIRLVGESGRGFKEIRVLGSEAYFVKLIRRQCERFERSGSFYVSRQSYPRYFLETLIITFLAIMVFFGAVNSEGFESQVAVIGAFGGAAMRILPSLSQIMVNISHLRFAEVPVKKLTVEIAQLRALRAEVAVASGRENAVRIGGRFESLALEDVSYTYAGSQDPLFSNVNLSILRGQFVGLVGRSGTGKSTLLDLMLGLLERSGGRVACNEIDVAAAKDDWLAKVCYIPQAIFVIEASIRENVAFGISPELIDDEKVERALRDAQLLEVVSALPLGTLTLLQESGSNLSGGQRQRLALARAFYANREFLILDEATSALDPETEEALLRTLWTKKGEITLLFVTHKVSILHYFDVVAELNNRALTVRKVIGTVLS